jgi:1-acyl-sn-glycerol-3-phosphate acyltransferase
MNDPRANKPPVLPGNEVEATKAATDLLRIAVQLMAELHPHRPGSSTINLDSSIDRDLGLDSLGRVELFSRIERAFAASLPEQLLAGAETPRDLLRALLASRGRNAPVTVTLEQRAAPLLGEAAPQSAATLTKVLDWHCLAHPDRTHIIFCNESGQEEAISYAVLRRRAGEIAHGLLQRGLEPGQTVAIMLPTCLDYFHSFFGVLLGGGIPVPIYPPARLSQIEDHLRRHAGILANAQVKILITIPEALAVARLLKSQVAGLRAVITPQEFNAGEEKLPQFPTSPQDTVLLQYTSGSTGNPKGVVLSHANLLANIRAMGQAVGVTATDVFVSWLPLYHDMGLIGAWLGSLFFASPLVIMSPLSFLARPEQWLWAIHRHRGTLSAAPNFAYELCVRKIPESAIQGLDLSSWRMACNGAEPVSPATMREFRERFAAHGFRPAAEAPVYGLAESSVGLAFPPQGRGLLVDLVKRPEFLASGHAIPAGPLDNDVLRFVACGQPLPGHQVRIVGRTGHELPERVEGRLEFKGPSATSGYFRNPEETRRLFRDTWLDSGDLAYLAGGDIYVTGRGKDIIIKAGRNIYPYELEEAVGGIPGIRRGCVAVFGSTDPASGTERLVVLAETRETAAAELDKLRTAINDLALDLLGTPPDDIVLAPPHTVLKTSSGKIRRAASRQFYEKGGSASRPSPVWLQLSRLAWTGALAQARRLTAEGGEVLYAGYLWGLFAGIAPIAWLTACLLPHQGWSWQVSRTAARLFLRLAGIPVTANGLDNLPKDVPRILAVNHASYLDGLVLVAALPGRHSFVAKRELQKSIISRLYLQRIGCEFVERFDFQQGIEDTGRIQRSVANGRSMVFFPEGTFRRMPGLLPFKMGAFLVGAQARVPVVPVAIRGTRSILHPDHWFPRRGSVIISVGSPLTENDTDWNAALRLKNAARAEILRHCGEPDLAEEE